MEARLTLDLFTRERRARSSLVNRIRKRLADLDSEELEMGDSVRRMRGAIDTNLIPPGAQYGATQGKPQKRKRLRYAASATLGKPLQRGNYDS